jgi:eukaryotic-like serine/threonine-protein kinase
LHLEDCAPCRELVSAVLATRTAAPTGTIRRLAPNTMLGRHRIERPLGSGGMGVVYLARDVELERDVAIKLLRTGDADAHDRLARESQVLARLNHTNVVTVHEVGRHGAATYLVMEHVELGTVRDWLATTPRTPTELAAIYAQAACGLAAAHAAGIIHRDIKPENILVGNDGRARISDFGLAGQALADPSLRAGTPKFMAPEVLAGAPADARSDQWSLAASLQDSLATATRVPRWLQRTVARGLDQDPGERFGSLDDFRAALVPPRSRARLVVPIVLAVATLGLSAAIVFEASSPRGHCGTELDGVWNHARRTEITEHVRTVAPTGMRAWLAVEPALDQYASRWTSLQGEVCHADTRDPVVGREAACLRRHYHAFVSIVDGLATLGPQTAEHVREAAGDLPPLQDCTASERLAGRQPLPADPATIAWLDQLERTYARARAQRALGERKSALGELAAIADHADALGYYPLIADALGVAGRAYGEARNPLAITTLQRAVAAAQAGGDDAQIADTQLDLVIAATILARPANEIDAWRELAISSVKRLAWRHDPAALRAESSLMLTLGRDDLARDRVDVAERELKRSIEIGGVLYGSRSHYLSLARNQLASIASRRGDYDAAATLLAASIDVDDVSWSVVTGDLAAIDEGQSGQILLDAAWKLHEVGRDDRALAFARQVRAETTDFEGSMGQLALDDLESEIALSRGDLDRARALNDRVIARFSPNAPVAHLAGLRLTRAEILENGGDLRAAEPEYRAALAGLDRDVGATQEGRLGLARCLAARGATLEARALIESLVAQRIEVPRIAPEIWLVAAQLRWTTGDHVGALIAGQTARDLVRRLPELPKLAAAIDAWHASTK